MSLLVHNIGELITNDGPGLGLVHDAAVLIVDGRVVFAGPRGELPALSATGAYVGAAAGASKGDDEVRQIDAGGRLVTPGLVEPHAHLVFAGSRAAEFDLRAQGKSYGEIQAAGGGILSTVRATRAASTAALTDGVLARLDRLLMNGVTVTEAKSGYDLTIDGELRLIEILCAARARHVVDVSPTLLAHVPPPELERGEWVRQFVAAIPRAAGAEAVDVYCDEGAFTVDETEIILTAARRAGRLQRVHAEQFTHTGAAELAAGLGARSVEHLEQLSAGAPAQLAAAGTVCNLLPGAALTLRLPWPDARRLLAAGCRVALGTDCNPGSSLTESLPLMMSLACMQMGLSCAEAWRAVTVEAAHAVGRDDAGRLVAGARGDLVIWDAGEHREVPQHFGVSLARTVAVRGRLAYHEGLLDARA